MTIKALCVGSHADGKWYAIRDEERYLRIAYSTPMPISSDGGVPAFGDIHYVIYTLRPQYVRPSGKETDKPEPLYILAPEGMSDREAVAYLLQGYRVPNDL